MHNCKRALTLLLFICLLTVALLCSALAASPADADTDTVSNPTTDSEIIAALETYDASIDDPEYQRAYDAYQKSKSTSADLETDAESTDDLKYETAYKTAQKSKSTSLNLMATQLLTFRSSTNPYTGNTYQHTHSKTDYIYDGVDVSKWQATINWSKAKADGIDFVFIRCGYTSQSHFAMGTDSQFATNIKNASAAGVKIGIYYFSQATTLTEAKKEAAYTLDLIRPYQSKISLPVAFDFEKSDSARNNNVSQANGTKFAQAFCSAIEDAGYEGCYYGSTGWLPSLFTLSSLKNYTCWAARYVGSKTNYAISYTGDYDFWQYTDIGSVNGIPAAVDCNFWYTDDKLTTSSNSSNSSTKITSSNTNVTLGYTTISYSGKARKPSVKVTYGSKTLTKETDYTVTYSDNTEPGTATVKVTGRGKYTGTLSKPFKITALTTPYITSRTTYYRTGCGTSHTSKGSIDEGKQVNVVYGWYKTVGKHKWYKVKIGSNYYYMYGPNLTQEVLVTYATTARLNYRTGTGTNHSVKGTFSKNADIQVVKGWYKTVSGHKWYKVKVGSHYYYCMAKYLKSRESISLYTTKATVNVRSSAGITNSLRATLFSHTPVAVLSSGKKTVSGDPWYKVKINTSYYYMMACYLTK